ncbi:methyltransferase domain-containing protein, partial [Candidatus Parcubacteria bacterium]|nr:methyltransferase domain-containing protein [Candidatus Parcubacteria bacterium]
MKYIFHLGRIPSLSVAELQIMLKKFEVKYTVKFISKEMLTLDIENEINFKNFLIQIGGTKKISKIIDSYPNLEEAFISIKSIIEKISGKKTIGYSFYSRQENEKKEMRDVFEKIRKRFIDIKRSQAGKTNIRLVFPDNETLELNSASIYKNKLTIRGVEFNIIISNDKILLSKTIAVQDVESYSQRDYGRPKRDSHIGMIPPKLAQIMINFADIKKGETILDPFCGIGTILQEALLNDYKIIGIDANDKQVENSKENFKWLSERYILEYPDYKIFQSDVGNITRKIKANSIDAIVTESTLGPVYKKLPTIKEMKQNFSKLEKVYLKFFQISKTVLRKKANLVVTLPAYKIKPGQYLFAPFIDNLRKIGYSVTCPLDEGLITKHTRITSRNSIIYDRADQTVAREVIIFKN